MSSVMQLTYHPFVCEQPALPPESFWGTIALEHWDSNMHSPPCYPMGIRFAHVRIISEMFHFHPCGHFIHIKIDFLRHFSTIPQALGYALNNKSARYLCLNSRCSQCTFKCWCVEILVDKWQIIQIHWIFEKLYRPYTTMIFKHLSTKRYCFTKDYFSNMLFALALPWWC